MALTRAFLNGVNYDDVNALRKPIFINGSMDICQRATSVTSITSQQKLTDRWLLNIGSSGTHTFTIGTGPGTFGLNKCIKIDCTSANNSGSDADANMYITTSLEGQDVQIFRKGTSDAKAFTISFFVRSNVTGTGVVEFWDRDNDRNIIRTYTIDSADTWERKVLNYDMETSNAFDNDAAKSVNVGWWIESGSDFDGGTAQTSWGSRTDANRAVGQTLNIASSTDNEFLLTGCMIVPGTFDSETIPDYPFENYDENLKRCERYFQSSFSQGTAAGTATAVGFVGMSAAGTGTGRALSGYNLRTVMRAAPTVTVYSTTNGTSGKMRRGDAGADVAAGVANPSTSSFHVENGASVTDGEQLAFGWQCEAEL